MPRLKTLALLVLSSVAVPLVLSGQQTSEKTFPAPAVGVSSAGLRQTAENYWQWRLAESPELATRIGRTDHNDRWRDLSKAARQRARVAREEFLQQALYVGVGNLTAAEHLTVELLEHELRTALEV